MKKLNYLIIVLLGSAVIFSSCKKDEEEEEAPAVIKCYLKSGTDSEGSYTITYNSSNQATKHTNTTKNENTSITWNAGKVSEVVMDSAGNNQMKMTIGYTGSQIQKIKIYQYSGSSWSYVANMHFVYNTDGKIIEKKTTDTTDATTYEKEVYTYTGNNITTIVETDGSGSSTTTTLTYDDKKNPMYGMGLEMFESDFISVNNVLTEVEGGNTTTYTYEYNSNGYPTKSTGSNGDNETMTYDCK